MDEAEYEHCRRCGNGYQSQMIFLRKRIDALEAEIQEVSNQLLDLYTDCNETAEPKVFGTILGLHERLEKAKPRT